MAEAFKIEHGIPIANPKGGRTPSSPVRLAMESMAVGDSFVIPAAKMFKDANAVHNYAKRAGIKITKRKLDNGDVRVWRIA